jgi:hypothetical protein
MLPRVKEESVKDKIKQILKEMKVPFDMPPANGYGRAGNFDFVCCVDGAYLGIEAKRDAKEQPTRLQTEHAVEFIGANGTAMLLHKDNLHLLPKVIDDLRARMRSLDYRVNYGTTLWPKEAVMALLEPGDKDVKVIKGKKK